MSYRVRLAADSKTIRKKPKTVRSEILKTKNILIGMVAAGGVLLGATPSVLANAQLKLVSGTTVLVIDGAGNDASGAAGTVSYVGAVGGWKINVTTGRTTPSAGSPTMPVLNLSSTDTDTAGTTADLKIYFTDDVYFDPGSKVSMSLAGNESATLLGGSFSAYWGTSDFDLAHLIHTIGIGAAPSNKGTSFSGSYNGLIPHPGPGYYSLTEVIDLKPGTKPGTYSITKAQLTLVPDGGATLVMLGIGLLGVGALRSKFSKV